MVLALSGAAPADEGEKPTKDSPKLVPPTVTFTLDFPRGRPAYFSITLDSAGHATYESRDQAFPEEPTEPAEPYRTNFAVSSATRERVFELARSLDHFRGDYDYTKRKIANMGRKTLVWWDGSERISTSYNWSENGNVDDLTTLFTSISATQEFGRRLEFLRRYDRLGLEAELKSMEERAGNPQFGLGELQTIAGLLQSIARDPAVMKIARQRAERLLRKAEAPAPSSP